MLELLTFAALAAGLHNLLKPELTSAEQEQLTIDEHWQKQSQYRDNLRQMRPALSDAEIEQCIKNYYGSEYVKFTRSPEVIAQDEANERERMKSNGI